MEATDDRMNDILEDDSFAPLKRNHACLQCKKRKVKCDATKPACAPCMRTHAHAMRNAQRNKTSIPVLICTYTDVDSPGPEDGEAAPDSLRDSPDSFSGHAVPRKKVDPMKKKGTLAGKGLEREKEKRRDEEKESLLIRIADLEERLERLSAGQNSHVQAQPMPTMQQPAMTGFPPMEPLQNTMNMNQTFTNGWSQPPVVDNKTGSTPAWMNDILQPNNASATLADIPQSFDFGAFALLPLHWPKALPPPYLLEHLVETFFNHVPQLPRMLHRATLMRRIRLSPSSEDFPHPALLHAICARAASHTAWVHTIPPESLEEAVEQHKKLNGHLDYIEDFSIQQGEEAQKTLRFANMGCSFGPGTDILEMCQAWIILTDLYHILGMIPSAWLLSGAAPRFLKTMEVIFRNKPKRYKEPIIADPIDDIDKEQRLAAVWMTFVSDAAMSLNTFCGGTISLREVRCQFPCAAEYFKGDLQYLPENTQAADTPDVFTNHTVLDPFVLLCKASVFASRAAEWTQNWRHQDVKEGDDIRALHSPEFIKLVNDVHAFQTSLPSAIKGIFKKSHDSPVFDTNLLLVHLIPNVTLCMLYEPFVNWDAPEHNPLVQVEKAMEGVLNVLHLIPSNLDVSLILNFTTFIYLYTIGRFTAYSYHRAMQFQRIDKVLKCDNDMQTIKNLVTRYGQKHVLGLSMMRMFDSFTRPTGEPVDLKQIQHSVSACASTANAPRKRAVPPSSRTSESPNVCSSTTQSTPSNTSMPTPPNLDDSNIGAGNSRAPQYYASGYSSTVTSSTTFTTPPIDVFAGYNAPLGTGFSPASMGNTNFGNMPNPFESPQSDMPSLFPMSGDPALQSKNHFASTTTSNLGFQLEPIDLLDNDASFKYPGEGSKIVWGGC